jgi:hypothetical protein
MTEINLELAFLSDTGMNAVSLVNVTLRTDDTESTDASQNKTDACHKIKPQGHDFLMRIRHQHYALNPSNTRIIVR